MHKPPFDLNEPTVKYKEAPKDFFWEMTVFLIVGIILTEIFL